MPELKELLENVEDETVAEQIKAAFEAQQQSSEQEKALLARDAKVAKESATLSEKYPRAMIAYSKGRLQLPEDDPSDEALAETLKGKEQELEDLGVPIPSEEKEEPVEKSGEKSGENQSAGEGEADKAKPEDIWGPDPSTGRRDNSVEDALSKARNAIRYDENTDPEQAQQEFITALREMNTNREMDKIEELTDELNSDFDPSIR